MAAIIASESKKDNKGLTEPVGQVHEVVPVHAELLEQLAGPGEVLFVDGQIT